MTRLTVLAAFALLLSLAGVSSASAQETEGWAHLSLADDAPSADALSSATQQHRIGAAFVAVGLTANLVGAGASFYGIIGSMSAGFDGGCFDCGRSHTDWGGIIGASLTTSAVGLVMFFIGLGLDIHAHVVRGRASSLALTGSGLTISF